QVGLIQNLWANGRRNALTPLRCWKSAGRWFYVLSHKVCQAVRVSAIIHVFMTLDWKAKAEEYDILSAHFRDLVLEVCAEKPPILENLDFNVAEWLGADPKPLFPEWETLHRNDWLPISLAVHLFQVEHNQAQYN
ncbi:hypothetical protein, partial [Deinococcus fonticola]|uniref:hypothetical protein n=1 Tax=Deinococcus fonticola TaxID=2528713 RepID=UPI00197AB8AC